MKQLFSLKEPQVNFLFKGGTSLSKVYGVIHRFSEDVDLSINPNDLGFDGENDPRQEGLSKNRRTKLIKALTKATEQLIGTSIKDTLEKTITSKLSEHYSLEVDAKDPQT